MQPESSSSDPSLGCSANQATHGPVEAPTAFVSRASVVRVGKGLDGLGISGSNIPPEHEEYGPELSQNFSEHRQGLIMRWHVCMNTALT